MRPYIGMSVRVKEGTNPRVYGAIGIIEQVYLDDPSIRYHYVDVRFPREIYADLYTVYIRELQYKVDNNVPF